MDLGVVPDQNHRPEALCRIPRIRAFEGGRGAWRDVENVPKPKSTELIGEGFLAIVWEDGHESFFEGPYLRSHCPCAACRVRRERNPPKPASAGLTLAMAPPRLVALEEVGRYAVRLRWSDGHSAGLYEFRLLRALCPCQSCSAG